MGVQTRQRAGTRGTARGPGEGRPVTRPEGEQAVEEAGSGRQPLSAPAAMPPMIRFWARKKTTSIGRPTMTVPARIEPQLV